MEGVNSDSFFGRLMSASGAIAAVAVAALYLGGMTTLMVRMDKAGLSSQDILPLFSLEQLLRVGLTWAYPVIPTLFGLAILYAVSVYFERGLSEACRTFEAQRADLLDLGERDSWVTSFAKIREDTDWGEAMTELDQAIDAHRDGPDAKQWKTLRRRLSLFTVWAFLVLAALFGACALLPAAVAIGTLIAIVVTWIFIGTRPAKQELLPIIAVVAIGYLSSAVIDPRPLPLATVTTNHPHPITTSGDLVVVSDATWYLSDGHGDVLAVPVDEIARSHLRSQPRSETLLDLLKNL